MKRHCVIPDTQCKSGVPTSHLKWIGKYIREKRPDVVVHLGDNWDMPSLNSYDREDKKRSFEGRRYAKDIEAGNAGLELLTNEFAKASGYKPKLILLRGNHENRIERAIDESPTTLEGVIGQTDFNDIELGWKPVPFLEPIVIDGISYCHYFCRSANGSVTNSKNGAPSAKAQVQREMMSCTAGHKQGLDLHVQSTPKGLIRGVIAGSCYQHEEDYLTPQGRVYWRGIIFKHEVKDGRYNLMEVSLDYLKRRYS